jgi:hypothetical protein
MPEPMFGITKCVLFRQFLLRNLENVYNKR